MVEESVIESISFLEKCLEDDGVKVEKIILFGSRAKGQSNDGSDIDLVIISSSFNEKGIYERAILTKNAEIKTIKKYLIPLDIVTLTPMEFENESSLAAAYAREGEVIYAM